MLYAIFMPDYYLFSFTPLIIIDAIYYWCFDAYAADAAILFTPLFIIAIDYCHLLRLMMILALRHAAISLATLSLEGFDSCWCHMLLAYAAIRCQAAMLILLRHYIYFRHDAIDVIIYCWCRYTRWCWYYFCRWCASMMLLIQPQRRRYATLPLLMIRQLITIFCHSVLLPRQHIARAVDYMPSLVIILLEQLLRYDSALLMPISLLMLNIFFSAGCHMLPMPRAALFMFTPCRLFTPPLSLTQIFSRHWYKNDWLWWWPPISSSAAFFVIDAASFHFSPWL